ncbi:MAG: cadmium-translocating P-type ATPase [Bacilli bacterium]|nr:cadmium-translocating P-type ATPase [Bacilli bacterium]
MANKCYKIDNFTFKKRTKRINEDLSKCECIKNYKLDIANELLYIEYHDEINMEQVLEILKKHDPKIELTEIENVQNYRKVLKLKGLDCGHCAKRIETLAKKEFKCDKIIVDFSTERFIIETQNERLFKNINQEVKKIVDMVDPRVEVMDIEERRRVNREETFKTSTKDLLIFTIGLIFFVAALIVHGIVVGTWEAFIGFSEEIPNIATLILLLCAYLLMGRKVLFQFAKNLIKGQVLDENFLMAVASIGAIITAHFIEAVAVVMLYEIGEFLQEKAVNYSRKSISELLSFDAMNARLKVGMEEVEVDVETIVPNDIIIVRNGELIPLDGRVIEGKSYLDTKALTGEAKQQYVKPGDEVLSGSINLGNVLEIKVTKNYNNSTMTRILDLVENASASKAKTEKFITKFSQIYTPFVVIVAVLFAVVSPFVKQFFFNDPTPLAELFFGGSGSIYSAMVFLVISCPCALVISIPLTYFGAIGVAGKNGILIKGSNYLEALNNVENVVFDKTGTLTMGEFGVIKINPAEGVKEKEILSLAAYVEYNSTHPIGRSIVEAYGVNNIFPDIIEEFIEVKGKGVRAYINGSKVVVCNYRFLKEANIDMEEHLEEGLTLYVLKDDSYLGYIVIGDKIRPDAKNTIKNLRKNGVSKTVILTGDSKGIAQSVARSVGIDAVYSELLPEDKVDLLAEIKEGSKNKQAHTIYIGDGINDAPVISSADVGIAMGTNGSEGSIAIADIVIMSDNLSKVSEAIDIAKKTRNLVFQNIFIALTIKFVVLVLSLAGVPIDIWLAIFSDVGVTLIAIMNALRIKRYKAKGGK